jgi:hypothetical protein
MERKTIIPAWDENKRIGSYVKKCLLFAEMIPRQHSVFTRIDL